MKQSFQRLPCPLTGLSGILGGTLGTVRLQEQKQKKNMVKKEMEIQKMVRVWVGSQLEQTNKKGNFELKMVADTRQPPVNVQHIYLL